MLEILNPDLIQSFYAPEKLPNLKKSGGLVVEIGKLIGNGLFFAEGDEWKKKKKILTSVFNFNFIKNQTPKIIRICDEAMDYIEKKHKKENSDEY